MTTVPEAASEAKVKPLFGGKSPKPLPWEPLPYMEDWLENLAVDGITQGYITSARAAMAHFSTFAKSEGLAHPDEIERKHILRFQAFLTTVQKQDGNLLSVAYRQQLVKNLRNWVGWLVETEVITANPWVRIRIGSQQKKPKPLEDDEIAVLFDAHRKQAFQISPFFYHRRETILVLLYGWGLRIHELQALSVANMDMRQDFVTARNKGGGTKTLPYADEMKQIVQRWLLQRAKNATHEEDGLLIDQQGQRLSTAMIYKIVTELGQRAGVAINPHRLRDSFGTAMLDNDVPVERIMKMMGHTQRSQTLAYARLNDPKLKESHDFVMNPLIKKLTGGPDVEPEAEEVPWPEDDE